MPTAAADRNLLCGILALQMDFVTRDQLIVAMHAWVLDKHKSLGQVLLEQRALAGDTHALLEALVQKHLAMHGDDPQKSLAALNEVGSARQQMEKVADADLQASLVHVSHLQAAQIDSADPYPTNYDPISVGTPSSAGLRFRILRPHLKGGQGQVSVAFDEELNREVALKEIQDRHADHPESQSRFLREAMITGGLEHPGIVPVYGLGHYATGRPFYAMRFIRGHSLDEAIKKYHNPVRPPCGLADADSSRSAKPQAEVLEFRKLLGRFIDVCNAIQYAHDRGVLHRDLKPGNIMLGKYGETLVVDWGLAKLLAASGERSGANPRSVGDEPVLRAQSTSAEAETRAGTAFGTPEYMSPEQADGRLDLFGPGSDVYSLGATLYTILTGRPSIEGGDLGEKLNKVRQGDFPYPRQIKADVPEALEAICLKAMSLHAPDRYASPRALAGDLEQWLAESDERWIRAEKMAEAYRLMAEDNKALADKEAKAREEVEKLRERELQIGRSIQIRFLPETLPQSPGWEIVAHFRPARAFGGDFYDCFPLLAHHVILVMADVSDRGVEAAVFMTLFRSLIRAFCMQTGLKASMGVSNDKADPIPLLVVEHTNKYVTSNHANLNMFSTLFMSILDTTTGELSYVNAGHEPPSIIGPQGIKARLERTGPVVGIVPEASFGLSKTRLQRGDILLAHTDGVMEARDPTGKFFTQKRFLEVVAHGALSAAALVDRILSEVRSHIGTADQLDDITLLAARWATDETKSGAGINTIKINGLAHSQR